MRVGTNIGTSERNRGGADDGENPTELTLNPENVFLDVADVTRLTAEAVLAKRLYVLPHRASRASIRRRFDRIDATFDAQDADGWTH